MMILIIFSFKDSFKISSAFERKDLFKLIFDLNEKYELKLVSDKCFFRKNERSATFSLSSLF